MIDSAICLGQIDWLIYEKHHNNKSIYSKRITTHSKVSERCFRWLTYGHLGTFPPFRADRQWERASQETRSTGLL